jgi:hypothetical protein
MQIETFRLDMRRIFHPTNIKTSFGDICIHKYIYTIYVYMNAVYVYIYIYIYIYMLFH